MCARCFGVPEQMSSLGNGDKLAGLDISATPCLKPPQILDGAGLSGYSCQRYGGHRAFQPESNARAFLKASTTSVSFTRSAIDHAVPREYHLQCFFFASKEISSRRTKFSRVLSLRSVNSVRKGCDRMTYRFDALVLSRFADACPQIEKACRTYLSKNPISSFVKQAYTRKSLKFCQNVVFLLVDIVDGFGVSMLKIVPIKGRQIRICAF